MSGIGHNSAPADVTLSVTDDQLDRANVASEELRGGVERIERLEEEKKGIGDDIKDVYSELKSKGYDTKTIRKIIALRKMKPDDRRAMESMLDTYKAALGMD